MSREARKIASYVTCASTHLSVWSQCYVRSNGLSCGFIVRHITIATHASGFVAARAIEAALYEQKERLCGVGNITGIHNGTFSRDKSMHSIVFTEVYFSYMFDALLQFAINVYTRNVKCASHLRTRSPTHSLTHSLTHKLTYPLSHLPTHSLTHSLTHCLAH